ncbi:TonB [Fibrisoma limi BUZ 3]|uniref:TonB n=2 Tax=Fibrisoma limi TaxID=663275 RepID=I2GGZ7_9BACT|nr:TonB [Fibrisoma limi BUZ 3]
MSTLAFAQAPDSSPVDNSTSPLTAFNTHVPASSIQPSDEYASLTNLPSFPGGRKALETFLNSLDLYPAQALETQHKGTVVVQFRVLPNGQLTRIRVVQSCGELLDKAALRAMALMPHWYPAHLKGVPVPFSVKLPITFRIN